MKKKVIVLTTDTALTNEQIERCEVELVAEYPGPVAGSLTKTTGIPARNVRVLDSDVRGRIKKKVISATIDTTMTNEQLEACKAWVAVLLGSEVPAGGPASVRVQLDARNVRVLDSDEL